MMKRYLKTYILLGFFLASLLVYWGLDHAGVRTEKERRLRDTRILPELVDVAETSIRELTIERGTERLVFKRRGQDAGRWQMVQPTDVAAEPTRLETLVRNLKDLRRSIDSGNVAGAADQFGLAPPVATVRVWGENPAAGKPIATLDVGKTVRGVRYVRADGADQIEIADSKLLSAIDLPLTDWREQVVMGVPTFQVASLTIKRGEQLIRAERNERGQWRLTAPVKALANSAKVESLLSALSSLRVVDGAKGFAADNVKDLAPFGLARAAVTVELTTTRAADERLVLHVGQPVSDHPDHVYVRQGDEDDVLIVAAKPLLEIPTTAVALRSQQIADVEPAAATQIEIQARTEKFALSRGPKGWELTSPHAEKADDVSVAAFLNRIGGLQTSEFFTPDLVKNPELDPPIMTVKIWQAKRSRSPAPPSAGEPAVVLEFGKHDALRKTVYARLKDDQTILAAPDYILEVLPKNSFAFRDLAVLSVNPADIRKLTLIRAGRTDELEPNTAGEPNRWRLRQPIDAPADTRTVTQILAMLSNLRADQYVADSAGDGKAYGLDHPLLEITWETDKTHRLKVGSPVPRAAAYYAQLDAAPFVFTIKTEVLKPLEAELRDHVVMSFPAARAQRIVLTWGWPHRTVAFRRRTPTAKGQSDWVDEPGSDPTGLDQSRISALMTAMAHLESLRFVQYDGEIQPFTGLHRPRLTIEVMLSAAEPLRVLKIGYPTGDGHVMAAEGTSGSGPVFLLPAAAWDALVQSGERFDPLPTNVFAPAR
jgi:hypothetical protein